MPRVERKTCTHQNLLRQEARPQIRSVCCHAQGPVPKQALVRQRQHQKRQLINLTHYLVLAALNSC